MSARYGKMHLKFNLYEMTKLHMPDHWFYVTYSYYLCVFLHALSNRVYPCQIGLVYIKAYFLLILLLLVNLSNYCGRLLTHCHGLYHL